MSTLRDNVFKVHQSMLAYALSQPELQMISVNVPMQLDVREEEKKPEGLPADEG